MKKLKSAKTKVMVGGSTSRTSRYFEALKAKKIFSVAGLTAIIAVLAIVVPVAVYRSNAATTATSLEPEDGITSSLAVVGSDSNASGGQYVRFSSGGSTGAITTPLKQSTVNTHYFVDGNGKAVLLTGSHTWNTFQDWGNNGNIQTLDFTAYVNMMLANNQNFTLLWTTELPRFCNLPTGADGTYDVTPMPWQRTGPGTASDGKPKFDLTKLNQAFFDRLRSRVQQLNTAGIYAGVYPFTGEWLNVFRCGDGYPFSGGNNINGISDGGGSGSIDMTSPNAITAFQDAYVEKMVDTLNDLPNVLWATSEESDFGSQWWNTHQIDHIHAYEASKPLQHPVGYGALNGEGDAAAYSSHAEWVAPYARTSPINSCGTGTPACKVNINDSDHTYFGMWNDSVQANRNYLWDNFMNGNQVIFMDPYLVYYPRENRNNCIGPVQGICTGMDNRYANLRANMGYTRLYADRMNLLATTPSDSRASTGNALVNTSAANPEYLVYADNGGTFTVNLSGSTKSLSVEWLNPSTGAKTMGTNVTAGSSSQSFTPPFSGDAVLYLH